MPGNDLFCASVLVFRMDVLWFFVMYGSWTRSGDARFFSERRVEEEGVIFSILFGGRRKLRVIVFGGQAARTSMFFVVSSRCTIGKFFALHVAGFPSNDRQSSYLFGRRRTLEVPRSFFLNASAYCDEKS